ncbi:uncharacterized protein LOC132545350 [Ylistrum balloti]|uniref:uncharacterized protein LOC132545350 n=1 Tax=Ylistrum balloti TaxID=509963 RepID=UPI0029058FDA|nr:uncharacterized protein LOC132545350 [Ylistrum balloti]
MGRGRRFAPSSAKEGIWFNHRGSESAGGNRTAATSTGVMLTAPFDSENEARPQPPPGPFRSKTELDDAESFCSDKINYKTSNRFSEHDNRNAFQDHGVYFGDGRDDRTQGRKIILPDLRLHHTETCFLKHFGRSAVDRDLQTTYGNSFTGTPTEKPPVHRRFPKQYRTPKSGPIKLNTTTPHWFTEPDVPHKTPTQVLAVSQEPFLKHNAWKYSNHGLRKIYPPYNRKTEPLINNEFNRYGAAFTVGTQ